MTVDGRMVLLREGDWNSAARIWKLLGRPGVAKVIGIQTSELRGVAEGISCTTCAAMPPNACQTRTGKSTKPHMNRYIAILAAVFAIHNEITISEEEHIEDML